MMVQKEEVQTRDDRIIVWEVRPLPVRGTAVRFAPGSSRLGGFDVFHTGVWL